MDKKTFPAENDMEPSKLFCDACERNSIDRMIEQLNLKIEVHE